MVVSGTIAATLYFCGFALLLTLAVDIVILKALA